MNTTNLYIPPRLKAHKLSAAVGSGKTRAAIAWIADAKNASRNVLYVAPTRVLIRQTEGDLRRAIAMAPGSRVRNVHAIHTDTAERGQVQAEALQAANTSEPDEGAVWLLTTATFLAIVSKVKRPELWTVILDEAFDPATFESIRLGQGSEALRGWDHFSELFTVDHSEGYRIVPREGKRALVDAVARSDYSAAGDRFTNLEGIARAVANTAIRCELVMTDGAKALMGGDVPTKRTNGNGEEPK